MITSIKAIPPSVALEHAVHEVSQRAPEILTAGKVVLIYEQNVVLEAGIEMCLEAEFPDHGVVMTIDVRVDAVHSLEDLPNYTREGLGKWDTWYG